MSSLYQSLFARKQSAEEIAEDLAQKAKAQREYDLSHPAEGHGISVKEAASLLNVSKSTIYRWIAKGKLDAHKSASLAGGRKLFWVDSRQVYRLEMAKINGPRYSDADLH